MVPPPPMTQHYYLASRDAWFPPQAIPITISSLKSPHDIICSQQQTLPWDCSTIPHSSSYPLCLLYDPCPCLEYVNEARITCVILITLRLSQISFTLSQIFLLCPKQLPQCQGRTHTSVPNPPRAGPILLVLHFPPHFLHPTELHMVLYILF